MKMPWAGIKSIVNVNSKTQFSPISHLLDNGTRMANIFNNYFVCAGFQIDKTIPRTKKSHRLLEKHCPGIDISCTSYS